MACRVPFLVLLLPYAAFAYLAYHLAMTTWRTARLVPPETPSPYIHARRRGRASVWGRADAYARARRNDKGHMVPDASEEDIQKSQGFENYELAKQSHKLVPPPPSATATA